MSDAPTAAASEAEQIAAVAADLLGTGDAAESELLPDYEPVDPLIPSSPAAPAAPATAQEADTFSFDVDLPDDMRFDIESEDDEDDDEPAPPVEFAESETGEYEDPEVVALRKRAIAAEKKAAFLEAQKVKTSRKAWEAEAAKFFPLCDPSTIEATSRRQFRRKAQAQHEAMKPHAARIRAQIEADARQQAATQWGKPQGGGPQVPPESVEHAEAIQRGFETRGLQGGILEMLRTGKLRV